MDFINHLLENGDVNHEVAKYLSVIIMILFIALICMVANFITRKVVIRIISHYIRNNRYQWDNILLEKKVFEKLSHIVPAIIIYYFSSTFPTYQHMIQKAAIAYFIVVGIFFLNTLLNAVHDIYRTHEVSKVKPIKGYIQVIKIIVIIIGLIVTVATLMGESPFILLSGIGALSAVILLVFKDSLLGLVAGIQLTANDMVQVGDWIEMPKYNADGDVIDISLNTVKVQNWDKTITTIPSYALISDSFKNWRGMQTAGGRRIMRALYIDTNSIKFCTNDMIEKFKGIHLISNYITKKQNEIEDHNIKNDINKNSKVNGRELTNIGVFRAYITKYIDNHPGINQEMTKMVRQLAPSERGLPLEIYAFTNDVRWAIYEEVQADIFDHLFAAASEFELRVFQNPTGHDFRNLAYGTRLSGR
jgi:miniconductance mechanosensitive channel